MNSLFSDPDIRQEFIERYESRLNLEEMKAVSREQFLTKFLMDACTTGCLDVVKLVTSRIDRDTMLSMNKPNIQLPVLHYAVIHKHLEIVDHLVHVGMDVNALDVEYLASPLHHAAHNGYVEIANILIKNGASVEAKDRLGRTPLELAISQNHPGIVLLLHSHGAKVV